jgi:hypothetical protein
VVGIDADATGEVTFDVVQVPSGGAAPGARWRGYIKLPIGFHPETGAPVALHTVGPEKPTQAAAVKAALATAAQGVLNHPQVQAALKSIPGGQEAAALLQNPNVRSAVESAVKKLKFW